MSFYGRQHIPLEPSRWYVASTLIIALLLSIVLSPWLLYLPSFMMLTIAWWSIKKPQWMTMVVSLVLGLIMEIIRDKTMGTIMMEYLLLTTLLAHFRYRFDIMPFGFQSLSIFLVSMAVKLPSILLLYIVVGESIGGEFFITPFLNALLWFPFVLLIVYPLYRPQRDELKTHTSI